MSEIWSKKKKILRIYLLKNKKDHLIDIQNGKKHKSCLNSFKMFLVSKDIFFPLFCGLFPYKASFFSVPFNIPETPQSGIPYLFVPGTSLCSIFLLHVCCCAANTWKIFHDFLFSYPAIFPSPLWLPLLLAAISFSYKQWVVCFPLGNFLFASVCTNKEK